MEFIFPAAIFGPKLGPDQKFDEKQSCEPTYDSNTDKFTWVSDLGGCGQELTKEK